MNEGTTSRAASRRQGIFFCGLGLALASALGCGGGGGSNGTSGGGGGTEVGSGWAGQFCSKASGCGLTITNCESEFASLVLTSSCQTTVLNASCADLTASTVPADLAPCLPSCSGTNATCNGTSTITDCASGVQFTFSCDGVCAAQGHTYTGECSASYMGQTASAGESCWCK